MIEHHPDRVTDFRRKFVRCLAHTGSAFSSVGSSGKPGAGAVHVAGIARADRALELGPLDDA
jgi:hypothetical protein